MSTLNAFQEIKDVTTNSNKEKLNKSSTTNWLQKYKNSVGERSGLPPPSNYASQLSISHIKSDQ
jgi:hypothetical protein